MFFCDPITINPQQDSKDVLFSRLNFIVALDNLQAEIAGLMAKPWLDHVNKNDYRGATL